MADIQSIAKSFVDYYYSAFDRNRAELSPLYRDTSMLTFEGTQYQGGTAIVEKLSVIKSDECLISLHILVSSFSKSAASSSDN